MEKVILILQQLSSCFVEHLSNVVYTHQRMDFLMLLPNGIRVVIEIDGKQHYSEGDISSPKLYAEMMVDTRKLQLKGYEVYRLGGL